MKEVEKINGVNIEKVKTLLPPSKHEVCCNIELTISGITYKGIVYKETLTRFKRAFVITPLASEDDFLVDQVMVSSEASEDRLITLVLTYIVHRRDWTIPIAAYIIAKLSTIDPTVITNASSDIGDNPVDIIFGSILSEKLFTGIENAIGKVPTVLPKLTQYKMHEKIKNIISEIVNNKKVG